MQKTNTWFDTARFGMFVHWSHCCQHGCELSWPLVGGVGGLPEAKRLTVAEYHSTAATFNPQGYDPVALAQLARRTGMQYAILTTKHHDGYAMYHTRQNDFSVEHAPYGKDITRLFLDAIRAEGLRVGSTSRSSTGITPTILRSPTPIGPIAGASGGVPPRRLGRAIRSSCSARSANC